MLRPAGDGAKLFRCSRIVCSGGGEMHCRSSAGTSPQLGACASIGEGILGSGQFGGGAAGGPIRPGMLFRRPMATGGRRMFGSG